MTMIDLHIIIPDIIGFSTSFAYAVIMIALSLRFTHSGKHYPSLLLAMGSCAAIDYSIYLHAFFLELHGKDISFLYDYIMPAGVSIEVCLIIFALLHMLYASAREQRYVIWSFLLVIATIMLYPLAYRFTLSQTDEFFCIANFSRFADTTTATVLTEAINVSMLIHFVTGTRCISKGYRMFRSAVGMYFSSDNARIRNKCISWLVAGMLYTIISVLGFMIKEPWMKHFHCYAVNLLSVIMVLIVLCNFHLMEHIEKGFHNMKRENMKISYGDAYGTKEGEAEPEDVQHMRIIFEHWANRPDRPYMQRGITVQSFADDLGLPVDVVYKYGHIVYGMPFRDWILELRG